jgi:Gpi18-like mannosyltransferase
MKFANKIPGENIIFISACVLLALCIRFFLFGYISSDYTVAFSPWYDYIKNNGGFFSLKDNFYFYSPAYVYLLAVSTYVPVAKIIAIKSIPVIFDFFLALCVYLIVKIRYRNGYISVVSFVLTLFIPTVMLNGALWGQFDGIHVMFTVLSVYLLIRKKYGLAFVSVGLALSFKLQAVFIIPVFLYLCVKKQFPVIYFFIIPVVYIISLLPTAIIGKPITESMLDVVRLSNALSEDLTANAPNIYQWIKIADFTSFDRAGRLFTVAVFLILGYIFNKGKKQVDASTIIRMSLLSCLLMPFLLPRMHERYFYAAEVISVLYAFYFPKYYFVPIIIQFVSFQAYANYLFQSYAIPMPYLAVIVLGLIVFVIANTLKEEVFVKQKFEQ